MKNLKILRWAKEWIMFPPEYQAAKIRSSEDSLF